MLIFLKRWTHTQAWINSWETTNTKMWLCAGNRIDKDTTLPWKIEDLGFGQRGVENLTSFTQERCYIREKCVEMQWRKAPTAAGVCLDPKGKEALRTFTGLSLREMPSFLLLMWVWCGTNIEYFQVKNYTLCSLLGLQDLKCQQKQPRPLLGTKAILCPENIFQKCDYYLCCAKNVRGSSWNRGHPPCPDKLAIKGGNFAILCTQGRQWEHRGATGAVGPQGNVNPKGGEESVGMRKAQQDPCMEIRSLQKSVKIFIIVSPGIKIYEFGREGRWVRWEFMT